MKLEVGKKYKDRVGDIVEIYGCYDRQPTSYPFAGDNGQRYAINGTWDKHAKTDKDLIEELNMLHLKLGKKYKDRDGNVIDIIETNSSHGDFRCIGKKSAGEYRRYRPDGKCRFDGCMDLIEELNMLHLEIGKKYKTKAGIVVEIIKIDAQYGDFRFIGKEEDGSEGRYRSGGECILVGNEADLIEEKVIELEVGKKYKNRGGDIVKVTYKSVIPCARPFKGLIFNTNTELWYMENGHHIADYTKSINDIIEEMDEDIKDKSFKSVQEIYAYLGAGGIVKAKNNAIIYYFENDELTREYTKDGRKDTQREKETCSEIIAIFDIDIFEKYERPIIKNWYDDIPEQGILCMVCHIPGTVNNVVLVYKKKAGAYYDTAGGCWSNARPATLDDLKQYLYETKL